MRQHALLTVLARIVSAGEPAVHVVFLTDEGGTAALPALQRLEHRVSVVAYDQLDRMPVDTECLLVDGTGDLPTTVAACRSPALRAASQPVILVTPMHALAVLKVTWGFDDWVLPDCGRAELGTRLRLAVELWSARPGQQLATGLEIDWPRQSVTVSGRPLNLTHKEFELLGALASTPGQVWTRAGLLRDVWGHQHIAGARTVDVHIRRVRSKLGAECAASIETVRKVGYKFVSLTA